MTREPYGFSTFCDDIRREEGNKLTFVGVYTGDLIVHGEFPATLAKFAISVSYRVWGDDPYRGDVQLMIFLPGDSKDVPTIKGIIALNQLKEEPDPAKAHQFHRLEMQFLFSPLRLKEPGAIKVRALHDNKIIKLGTIRVTKNQPESKSSKLGGQDTPA
jgi:hypothetical protein